MSNVFDDLVQKVKEDFSILSQDSQDKIISMIEIGMRDAYNRGVTTAVESSIKQLDVIIEAAALSLEIAGPTEVDCENAKKYADLVRTFTTKG